MTDAPLTVHRQEDDVVVVELRGDQDLSTAAGLRDQLTELVEGGSSVVVELGLVSFMDSTVLGALLGGLRRARERGQDFALVIAEDTEPAVRRVFELTGLFRAFPVYPSRDEALRVTRASRVTSPTDS
jgi:anti-sigma B factor antagonist